MKVYKYKYEMHLHTAEVSACAKTPAKDYAEYYALRGYTGICVTDHFFNGNVTEEIRGEADWKRKVELFCRGYELLKEAAKPFGLDVFFGWEYSASQPWMHLLTYGLDKQWLLSHPDLCEWKDITYLDKVHADGGFVVHAHPFRDKVDAVHLYPDHVDAIESINSSQSETANMRAKGYAGLLGLPTTAGSDMHEAVRDRKLGAVLTKTKIADIREYTKMVRNNEVKGVLIK